MKRVGWYVNNNFFLNKWEAIEKHGSKNISFYFYEDIFDKYDWTKPIDSSLNDLYWLRAQQLRDSYDYIRLWKFFRRFNSPFQQQIRLADQK